MLFRRVSYRSEPRNTRWSLICWMFPVGVIAQEGDEVQEPTLSDRAMCGESATQNIQED